MNIQVKIIIERGERYEHVKIDSGTHFIATTYYAGGF